MDVVEESKSMVHSGSEGASLGNLVQQSIQLNESGETKGAVSDKRPAEGGLFAAPEPNSKRQRQSRYIVVDGHAVLRDNNYGIHEGFISVYDGAEFQTGDGKIDSEAIRAAEKSDDYYINAAGEVRRHFHSFTLIFLSRVISCTLLTLFIYPSLIHIVYSYYCVLVPFLSASWKNAGGKCGISSSESVQA